MRDGPLGDKPYFGRALGPQREHGLARDRHARPDAAQLLHADAVGRQLDRCRELLERPQERRVIDRVELDPDSGLERWVLLLRVARQHVDQRVEPAQRLSARREPAPLGVAGEKVRDPVEREVEHRERIALQRRARALHLELVSGPDEVSREILQAIAVAHAQPGTRHVRL